MAKKIAADGEGASRLIECTVSGAQDVKTARVLAKAVISSNLVKAAMFGKDANWGRILCALGYSGAPFSSETASVAFASGEVQDDETQCGVTQNYETVACEKKCCEEKHCASGERITVFENGVPLAFDEARAKKILSRDVVYIFVELCDGKASGTAWGCDLTYDYVKINGDYRT